VQKNKKKTCPAHLELQGISLFFSLASLDKVSPPQGGNSTAMATIK
jgi:hypothetical protein